jgi:hypothetical protein
VKPIAAPTRSRAMRRLLLATFALLAIAPAGAAAAGPQPPDCPLYAPRNAVDHRIALPNGATVVARDPYGGLLPRNRLFFDFSLRKRAGGGAPPGVAEVTWALDGKVVRTDPKPPYEWKGLSSSNSRMPAGDHQITVTVAPTGGGSPVSTSFALTATDCQPASAFVQIDERLGPHGRRASQLDASSAFESDDGPTMTSVAFSGSGFAARLPRALGGRDAGTLVIDGSARGSFRLTIPRRGTTLLHSGSLRVTLRPGARRFLTVAGLPGGVHQVSVRLRARGLFVKHRVARNRCHYSSAAEIAGPGGEVLVSGGTSSGQC